MVKTSKYGHLDISKVEPICHLFDYIYLKLHFHEFFSCIQDALISIALGWVRTGGSPKSVRKHWDR